MVFIGHPHVSEPPIPQHTYRSLRRYAAIQRKEKQLFNIQQSKLKQSWEFVQERSMLVSQLEAQAIRISELHAENESLQVLVRLARHFEGEPTARAVSVSDVACQAEPTESGDVCADVEVVSSTHSVEDVVPISMLSRLLQETAEKTAEKTAQKTGRAMEEKVAEQLGTLLNELKVKKDELQLIQQQLDLERQKSTNQDKHIDSLRCELKEKDRVIDELSMELDYMEEDDIVEDASSSASHADYSIDCLRKGDLVILVGLVSKPELNGSIGSLHSYDTSSERWEVQLADGSGTKLFKQCNLMKHCMDTDVAVVRNWEKIQPSASRQRPDMAHAFSREAPTPPAPAVDMLAEATVHCAAAKHVGAKGELCREEPTPPAPAVNRMAEASVNCAVASPVGARETHAKATSEPKKSTKYDDAGLVRNDLGLPTRPDNTVDWSKVLDARTCQILEEERFAGTFRCGLCHKDITEIGGNYGYLQHLRPDGEWEQKHLLDLIEDPPLEVRCERCHKSQTHCKYHARGCCARGNACAYRHI